MGKLFGTDGARGVAGKDLTPELAMQIGRAAAAVLAGKTQHRPRFIIGKDTRISSDMLEAALMARTWSCWASSPRLLWRIWCANTARMRVLLSQPRTIRWSSTGSSCSAAKAISCRTKWKKRSSTMCSTTAQS